MNVTTLKAYLEEQELSKCRNSMNNAKTTISESDREHLGP